MHKLNLRRISLSLAALATYSLLFLLLVGPANALQFTNRSIVLSSALPAATATHTFQFTYASTTAVGSVVFEYCENSPLFGDACSAPAGLSVSSAVLLSQTGNIGFSFDSINSTANKIVITRAPLAAAAVASSYTFDNITNPSTASSSQFVRISTYVTINGSGPYTDNGSVAFATQPSFSVAAAVPPFLQICVAITVAGDCSTSSGDRINLGTLSAASVKAGASQFAVATNSVDGYIVYILGTTMTSGNNTITALAFPTPSFPGNSQFGINLRANSIPNVGADPSGSGSGTPTVNYNTPNLYKFTSGESITTSTLPSDYNLMTISYIVNVSSAQPPGVYASTFSYLATANF